MSLGVSFALTSEQVAGLRACEDDDARREWLEDIEESGDSPEQLSYDRSWDALQRCLGDGTLEVAVDAQPLAYAVLGSESLMDDDAGGSIAGLLPMGRVPDVATAVAAIDEAALRSRFARLADTDYVGAADEEDFQHAWDSLRELQVFLALAAQNGWAIVFTLTD